MGDTALERAERIALETISGSKAGYAIDLSEDGQGLEAACALWECLGLAKKGLLQHTKVSPTLAYFDATPAGHAALQQEGERHG